MARPQAFNEKDVLEEAMQVFWRQGYANTSVKDLTEVTHLQPGSLYAAFKNKRNLFLLSLDYYFEHLYSALSCILKSEEAPLKRIRQFFDYILNQQNSDKELKSCLLVNTLLEIPAEDSEINQRVSAMFSEIENEFSEVLKLAQKDGSLINGGRPEAIAKMLMSGIFGLQVYNKMNPDQQSLNQIVNNLLANLEKN